ncbi:hypothetical protein [Lutibaculum baratangense]|uniref:Uncharacterized protein n=1 Tax=Lutibaculum baratangense AMV1 TaxID=631454 RepID=V4T911_9HYPH|nr:hypothetical protein [Lutibaculum baratangense]ESR23028.1 hypothetical protein N177_3096 [Lutibaculum baratangense AMV1]
MKYVLTLAAAVATLATAASAETASSRYDVTDAHRLNSVVAMAGAPIRSTTGSGDGIEILGPDGTPVSAPVIDRS